MVRGSSLTRYSGFFICWQVSDWRVLESRLQDIQNRGIQVSKMAAWIFSSLSPAACDGFEGRSVGELLFCFGVRVRRACCSGCFESMVW